MFKTVRIDTKSREIKFEDFRAEFGPLGNRGLIARVMSEEVNPECDPLGPENKLIVCLGGLAGTNVPTAHRLSVGGKSPLTGGIKEANVGGTVGSLLARHGIKMIIFENKSDDDSWYILKVDPDGNLELLPADDLAGLNNYALMEKLTGRYGKNIGVLSVGVAGERLYRNSTLQATDMASGLPSRAAARGGLGAVAGSKKLKAIVVERPSKRYEVTYDDKDKFTGAQKKYIDVLTHPKNASVQGMTRVGTIGMLDRTGPEAIAPVRNFSGESFGDERLSKVNSGAWLKMVQETGSRVGQACQAGCVVRCSNEVMKNGEYITSGFEYETVVLCGTNCDIDDLETIALIDRACDDLGIDTIETGATLAVCMDGGKIPWGDGKAALGLIEEMNRGTEFGKLLGQGTEAVGKALGVRRIPTVKGQAIAAYDPRNLKGIGVTYATSTMGADHTNGVTLIPGLDPRDKTGQVAASQNMQTMNATCDNFVCMFAMAGYMRDPSIMPDLLSGLYGGEWDMTKVMSIGEQTLKLEREFNKAAGFTEKDDVLPEFFYTDESPATGVKFDITPEEMRDVFK